MRGTAPTATPSATPRWVWGVIAGLAATQPLIGLWLTYAVPAGYASSGLHIPDSALFLHSMDMFATGFESRYATCLSPWGWQSFRYFPLPHLWLYGALGALTSWVPLPRLVIYTAANGLGAAVYLYVVYRFLRVVAAHLAGRAFLLFTLSGGLGGLLYAATALAGLHDAPMFEDYFRRFALYELFEGAHLQPMTYLPRLYYTVSLACCFGALLWLVRWMGGSKWAFIPILALVPLGTFIDLRYGVFAVMLAGLFLWTETGAPTPLRDRGGALFGLAFAIGAAPAWYLLHSNPVAVRNHYEEASHVMWLTPFLAVALFHLPLAPWEIARRIRAFGRIDKAAAMALVGYLGVFAALFAAYQAYWGNLLVARDAVAPVHVSDWALLGVPAGALAGLWLARRKPAPPRSDWTAFWFLLVLSLSISAFGRGWFLRFGPQRLEILLWLPLCLLSAGALERVAQRWPRLAAGHTGVMVGCGVLSVLVSALCFQGPLGYVPGRSPYHQYHAEVITQADRDMIAALGSGSVLCLPPVSDSVVQINGNCIIFGIGSFNCSDYAFSDLRSLTERFFDPATEDAWRRQVALNWCIEYIVCPDTYPIAPATVAQLQAAPWLRQIAGDSMAGLFEVQLEPIAITQ